MLKKQNVKTTRGKPTNGLKSSEWKNKEKKYEYDKKHKKRGGGEDSDILKTRWYYPMRSPSYMKGEDK